MSINLNQNNKFGDNNSSLSNSGNETKINNTFIWKMRAEGFVSGIIISVIASYIYTFLTK